MVTLSKLISIRSILAKIITENIEVTDFPDKDKQWYTLLCEAQGDLDVKIQKIVRRRVKGK